MSQALYRKYRSKSLDELVGQDHIVKALSASIKSGKISHAYLFTGPKGTGKTSVARILAHDVNAISYDESVTNLDIIEIDAASNRRIDEIRDLREKVHIAPTSLKYKVYIIDEVHMLTKEAFNALLKTLEEPPAHVIFILATTELHKVPDTIISRTQRYTFRPIEQSKLVGHLKTIAKAEKIQYDDEALLAIAEHADGGFRDAIGLLDQVRHTTDKVTVDSIMDALGVPPAKAIEKLWEYLQLNDTRAVTELNSLYESGYPAPQISKVLLQSAISSSNVQLARNLLAVNSSYDPKTELLLIVLPDMDTPKQEAKVYSSADEGSKHMAETPLETTITPKEAIGDTVKANPTPLPPDTQSTKLKTRQENWEKTLEAIKKAGYSLYGPLRLADATIGGGILKIRLAFPFHIKRINEKTNLEIIHKTLLDVTGKEHEIVVERIERTEKVDKASDSKLPPSASIMSTQLNSDSDASLMSDPLSIVKNVFGNAEVL